MKLTDPIADMFSRIMNALQSDKNEVLIPHSKVKQSMCKIMKDDGFIRFFEIINTDLKKQIIKVGLKYDNKKSSIITEIKRVSRPSKRVYVKKSQIPRVRSGYGTSFISTSKGILSGKHARIANVGGEYLGYIL